MRDGDEIDNGLITNYNGHIPWQDRLWIRKKEKQSDYLQDHRLPEEQDLDRAASVTPKATPLSARRIATSFICSLANFLSSSRETGSNTTISSSLFNALAWNFF